MRLTLRALAAVGFLSFTGADCCGVGGPELVPERAVCTSFWECSIAVKARVAAVSSFSTSDVVAVDVDPPGLLEVTIDGPRLVLQPRLAGDGYIRVVYADGATAEASVRASPLAKTRVVPVAAAASEPGAIYRGGELRVMAEHLDEHGARLLGHGYESWAITGGALREVDGDPGLDSALERIAVAGDTATVSVTAGTGGEPLTLDVVPPGATARLSLDVRGDHTAAIPRAPERTVSLQRGANAIVAITPFTADGRPIHGLPTVDGLAASSTDPGVAAVEVSPATREVKLRASSVGDADVEIRLDGQLVRFHVRSTAPTN
jgi:hypothetical protein